MNCRRIRRLRIDGFGHWRDQEWEIHPRLQLVVGQNEAGKSTLLGFIRGILYGFESRHSPHRYEPSKGGAFGGSIWMMDEAGLCVQIQRLGKGRVSGQLSVHLPDGQTAGEDWLKEWLGRIDKQTFRQVFAFGLDDLQQVRWLKEEALTPFLYHTLAGTGISLGRVQKRLAEREAELFRPRAKSGHIQQTLQQLEVLEARCRNLRNQQEQADSVRERLAQVHAEITELEQKIATRQEQLGRLERIARLLVPYRRLKDLEARLQEACGELVSLWLTDDIAERLSVSEKRLKDLRERRETVKRQMTEVQSRLEGRLRSPSQGRDLEEAGRLVAGVFLGFSFAIPFIWLLLFQIWKGEQSLFSFGMAAVLFLLGACLAVAFRQKVAKVRRVKRRLMEMGERLKQEEERLERQIAAEDHVVSCLREAGAIRGSFGEGGMDPQWQTWMSEWSLRGERQLLAERERLETALARQMEIYSSRLEERGRLLQQLEASLQSAAALVEAQQEALLVKARLQQLARQWSAVVLARAVLEEAMAVLERERQPLALQRASAYFSRLTAGRYVRVLTPLGQRELLVERHDGERLSPTQLSRGTLEQLLLAMRLAVVEEYSSRVALPLVMDDIFVNFDPWRLSHAVQTLKQLSRRRQILFFTCHPHVEAAFRQALAGEDWACMRLR